MAKFLLLILVLISTHLTIAQKKTSHGKMPIIRAFNPQVSFRDGDDFYFQAWRISPQAKPDIYETAVSKPKRVAFITDIDSISFDVVAGKTYDFIILLNGKDSAYTQIKATQFIEPAVFSKEYIAENNNKTTVQIPEVYELINVIFAITQAGRTDENIVQREGPYYQEVIKYFEPYKNHVAVTTVEELLKQNKYFTLKMDAYCFYFDAHDKIVQSKTYDRVAWGNSNAFLPFVKVINDFSDKSGFRKFFKEHHKIYNDQIVCYRDTLQTGEMQKWLNKNFPDTRYNAFKIIFSPLVSWNQSANWFDNNGFKEAQAHVNFPYPYGNWLKSLSPAAAIVAKGNIVFTELNHAFINPEGEKKIYNKAVNANLRDLSEWEETGKPATYYGSAYQCFNEYMNWGLVSLRYLDYAPAADQEILIERNEKNMTTRRGFKKFNEFDQFLVKIYKERKPGQTVADLYPQIVAWFGDN